MGLFEAAGVGIGRDIFSQLVTESLTTTGIRETGTPVEGSDVDTLFTTDPMAPNTGGEAIIETHPQVPAGAGAAAVGPMVNYNILDLPPETWAQFLPHLEAPVPVGAVRG